nr:MFS transporter [uncultured Carboxylicivirga sp.]
MEHSKFRWIPLFITNFLGVLNDNYLKYLIIYIGITWNTYEKEFILSLASALFVVPYILFSPIAGKLARDHSKAKIIQRAKLFEIPIMIISAIGFMSHNMIIAMTGVFLMGLQSALFSPAKYGIIRDIGGKEGIPYGTGAMEMLTFLGVLIGTYSAGVISDTVYNESLASYRTIIVCTTIILIAIIGWLTSLKINPKESVPDEEDPTSLNPFVFMKKSFLWSKKVKGLNLVILGLASFWAIGSLLQLNVILYGQDFLHLSDSETSIIMALVAIGIGAGCYFTGVISNHKLKMYLVPIGGLGMGISVTLIYLLNPSTTLFTILIILTAFFAGIFKIPLNSFIQSKVKGRKLGEILAYNNLVLFSFILIASGIFFIVSKSTNSVTVFATIAGIIWLITIITWLKIPGSRQLNAEK